MRRDTLIVLKFGGSVFNGPHSVPEAADEIYRWVRRGWRVIAAVSAMTGETDRLLRQARTLSDAPAALPLAQLASVGELESSALLGIALDRAGIPAEVLDSAAIGLRTAGPPTDADPVHVHEQAVLAALERVPVLVVPGFIGRDEHLRTTLLGRGGSDMTALFLACRLGARCRLVKDVDGLYEHDPNEQGPNEQGPNEQGPNEQQRPRPRRFARVHWSDLARIGGKVVQAKTAAFAAKHRIPFEIGGLLREDPTLVGDYDAQLHANHHAVPQANHPAPSAHPPMRVVLLGHGTVGVGVVAALARWRDRFQLVRVAVRDRAKAIAAGLDPAIVTTDVLEAVRTPADVVVEVMGGRSPAAEAMEAALRAGRHVVTANKAVIATDGDRLDALAAAVGGKGVRLLRSASVGGGVPMLEAVERLAAGPGIERFEAVLNGTTNFVLGRVAEGAAFDEAVREAQEAGFAEADPSRDLDGVDAEDKLRLLIRAAFGVDGGGVEVRRTGLSPSTIAAAKPRVGDGRAVRLVARASRDDRGTVRASIAPEALDPAHPLAGVVREGNAIVLRDREAVTHVVRGKGAGRWPTAQAVLADLIDLICPSPRDAGPPAAGRAAHASVPPPARATVGVGRSGGAP